MRSAWIVACLLASGCGRGAAERAAVALEAASAAQDEAARLAADRNTWQEREAEYQARIAELTTELEAERVRRREREQEWLEFTRVLHSIDADTTDAAPGFLAFEPPEVPEPEPQDRAEEERLARRRAAMLRDLRAFMMADQVLALDMLEIGRIGDGFTGPVVVRLVDDWGRPAGTLAAERFRLEPSVAGRSITLVFEEGFESHGGIATPFGTPSEPGGKRGGVRRIYLPGIDTKPWIEAFPELIDPDALDQQVDDGKWDLVRVRTTLNDLLRNETRGEQWRLRSFAGVVANELRETHLVQLDLEGRVVRRLFADGMRIKLDRDSIRLILRDGIQERSGRSAPFLEGQYRITLPGANVEEWTIAKLPGVQSEETLEAAPEQGD